MTRANKAASPAIVGDGRNGTSTRIAAAGLVMLVTFWVGTARNSAAKGNPGIRSADLKISVRVDNQAGFSARKLRFAENEAAKIYARAGSIWEWHECPTTARAESADLPAPRR